MINSNPILFSFDYPPLSGGIARLCQNIVDYSFKEKKTSFNVITKGDNKNRISHKRIIQEFQAYKKLNFFSKQEKKPPFILTGIYYPEAFIASLTKLRPIISLAHGAEFLPSSNNVKNSILKNIRKYTFKNIDLIIANSIYTQKIIQNENISVKVVSLPLGVNHHFFIPSLNSQKIKEKYNLSEYFLLFSVSRILRFKGYEKVFLALKNLPEKYKNKFKYLIAGEGKDLFFLKNVAKEMNVDHMIKWLGFVSNEELVEYYQMSDLFVLFSQMPSDYRAVEGFGLVFLEAQACGTPAIGTKTGGISDAIDDNNGSWLFDPNDVNGLANLLINLYDNPKLLKEQSLNARKRVEKYCTWEIYINNFFKIIDSIVHM